jgi:hypothetical protein
MTLHYPIVLETETSGAVSHSGAEVVRAEPFAAGEIDLSGLWTPDPPSAER